jgi:hypothetical protein
MIRAFTFTSHRDSSASSSCAEVGPEKFVAVVNLLALWDNDGPLMPDGSRAFVLS